MTLSKASTTIATFSALFLAAPQTQAQEGPLEKSLVVLDFAVERPFLKTTDYCDQVAEGIKRSGAAFSQLSRKDALAQLQSALGSESDAAAATLKTLKTRLGELEELIYAKPKKAIGELQTLISKLKVIKEKGTAIGAYRKLFFEIHISLARAQNDSRDKKGLRATLNTLIPFMGDAKVTDENYHPDVVKAWNKAKSELASSRTAKLKVTVQPAGAEILVNGYALGEKAPITVSWFPGEVFVQARQGDRISKARKISLAANKTTEVAIDLEYEAAVDLSGERVLVTFPSRKVFDARGGEFAKRMAKALDVDMVAWCGLVENKGATALEGYVVDGKTGMVRWGTSMVTKANVVSMRRTRDMAMFLATGGQAREDEGGGTLWYENAIGWSLIGVGLVGAGLGGAYHAMFGETCDRIWCKGDYSEASGLCEDFATRTELAEQAEVERAIRNTGFAAAGVGITAGILVMILMQPSDKPNPDDVATPTLRSLGPWVGRDTTGVSLSLGF